MYSGITKITQEAISTTFSGIDVHSSILSEADESNNANIINGIGSSEDFHLLIKQIYGKNSRNTK